ncbi:MAG: hypothetical protein QME07_02435 [bacterium]|nr:hypothetical protein [bacterium]
MNNQKAFSFRQGELLADLFCEMEVNYLFIGKSGAIILGYPDTTQDVDIYPKKDPENGRRIVNALLKLGFELDEETKEAIVMGKDFVQIKSGPFDVDLVFAPDGLEDYDRVKKRAIWVERIPVAHITDIIKSKEAAKRERDIRDLPFLKEFAKTIT